MQLYWTGQKRMYTVPPYQSNGDWVFNRTDRTVMVFREPKPITRIFAKSERDKRWCIQADNLGEPVYGWVDKAEVVTEGRLKKSNPEKEFVKEVGDYTVFVSPQHGQYTVMLYGGPHPRYLASFFDKAKAFNYASRVGTRDIRALRNPHHSPTPESLAARVALAAAAPNPEPAASALYEAFHGTPSTETVEVAETIHEHGHLATLGTLQSFKIHTPTNRRLEITFESDQPYLASNENGTQLYVVGGDQSVDLKSLGLAGKKWYRDCMLLGVLEEVTYRTKKGFHNFKLIDYFHKLGEETGVEPVLAYDTLNEKFSIIGGQYKVKPEGIVN